MSMTTAPIASAVLEAAEQHHLALAEIGEVEVLPSRGIVGMHAGHVLTLGARRLLHERDITLSEQNDRRMAELEQEGKTVLVLARDEQVLGALAVADTIRAEVPTAITQLRRLGIRRILLLPGRQRTCGPGDRASSRDHRGGGESAAGRQDRDRAAVAVGRSSSGDGGRWDQ